MTEISWPWQYNFPPFFTIQPNTETREKQLDAWLHLVTEYLKAKGQATIDIGEALDSPLFYNAAINRRLSAEGALTVLKHMASRGRAEQAGGFVWNVYWHSPDEWGDIIYQWATNNGMTNTVCTLFELTDGDNTVDQEFHGLAEGVLLAALRSLQRRGRAEIIDQDQGVKFF